MKVNTDCDCALDTECDNVDVLCLSTDPCLPGLCCPLAAGWFWPMEGLGRVEVYRKQSWRHGLPPPPCCSAEFQLRLGPFKASPGGWPSSPSWWVTILTVLVALFSPGRGPGLVCFLVLAIHWCHWSLDPALLVDLSVCTCQDPDGHTTSPNAKAPHVVTLTLSICSLLAHQNVVCCKLWKLLWLQEIPHCPLISCHLSRCMWPLPRSRVIYLVPLVYSRASSLTPQGGPCVLTVTPTASGPPNSLGNCGDLWTGRRTLCPCILVADYRDRYIPPET